MRVIVFIPLLLSLGCSEGDVKDPGGKDSGAFPGSFLGLAESRTPLAYTSGFLDNTEYAAEPWVPEHGRARGWVMLGVCTSDGWHKSPFLGVPSCLEPWQFPVKATVLHGVWVRKKNSLAALQIGRLLVGDVVVVHEVWVEIALMDSYMAPLMAEIEFPKERELGCR